MEIVSRDALVAEVLRNGPVLYEEKAHAERQIRKVFPGAEVRFGVKGEVVDVIRGGRPVGDVVQRLVCQRGAEVSL